MSAEDLKHVTIIGVGLLGGSVGLAVKARFPAAHVAGVGRRQSSLDAAMKVGAIDSAHLDAREVVAGSDLVILATPVGTFEEYLSAIADQLGDGAIVTDVGSTKSQVVATAQRILGAAGPFVGSHPMAGSEKKGPAYARADLFAGATCILTPTDSTPAAVTERIERFWQAIGMRTLRMPPDRHDRAMAMVSHLPHALACLLMLLPDDDDLKVSATGFRDATRLASGDPEMWRDIFLTNRRAMLAALDSLSDAAGRFRSLVESGDSAAIEQFLADAKARREPIARQADDRRPAME